MRGDLPPIRTARRLADLRERIGHDATAEALIVTDLVNVRWCTGFTGSNGWLVVLPDRAALVTDGRYGDQAADQVGASGADVEVIVGSSLAAMMSSSAQFLHGARRIGVEAHHMTLADHARWSVALAAEMVATTALVEGLRRRKDSAEIARIASAADIASQALHECAHLFADAVTLRTTERDVRDALETRMRELGADGPGYETIVATGGRNASRPHHRPDHTPLEAGHTVIVDVGAAVDGYRSDMTRTFVVGEPTQQQLELYDLVRRSQAAGLAAVGPGVACRDVDRACREVIAAAGHGDDFRHGTGHGVGLLIHEDPYLNSSSEAVLQEGDVVTVEPGVYRGDFGGLRLEDLVVVTADGSRNLTSLAKDSPCPPSPPTT